MLAGKLSVQRCTRLMTPGRHLDLGRMIIRAAHVDGWRLPCGLAAARDPMLVRERLLLFGHRSVIPCVALIGRMRRRATACDESERRRERSAYGPRSRDHSFLPRSLSALLITDTELKLMAAAAKIGLSKRSKAG